MRLLFVEDDPKIASLLKTAFEEMKWTFEYISNAEDLRREIEGGNNFFDLVLLDRMLEDKDSMSMIEDIKRFLPNAGLIVLSAIGTANERARAIYAGADDYVSKPFLLDELVARMLAVRNRMNSSGRFLIKAGDLQIDLVERSCAVHGVPVVMTSRELVLLAAFARNPKRVFKKEEILEQVWKVSGDLETKSVEVTIKNIRKKLAEASSAISIHNERLVGYWLET